MKTMEIVSKSSSDRVIEMNTTVVLKIQFVKFSLIYDFANGYWLTYWP